MSSFTIEEAIQKLIDALIMEGHKPYALIIGRAQYAKLLNEVTTLNWYWPSPYENQQSTYKGLVLIDSLVESELQVLPLI